MLAGYSDDPQHWPPEVSEALSYLSAIGSTFLTAMTNTVFQASKRLNQLPRDDPFWRNTNLRPMIYKLPEHCEQILRNNPNDVLSLLTIVVLDIVQTGDFKSELWSRLYRLKAVSLEFVAFASMLEFAIGGIDAKAFCAFLQETGNDAEALSILQETTAKGGKRLAEWSATVVSLVPPRAPTPT